jgi:hypothetical protein
VRWLNVGCGDTLRDVVAPLWGVMAQCGMWWLGVGCDGSVQDVVAQLGRASG